MNIIVNFLNNEGDVNSTLQIRTISVNDFYVNADMWLLFIGKTKFS